MRRRASFAITVFLALELSACGGDGSSRGSNANNGDDIGTTDGATRDDGCRAPRSTGARVSELSGRIAYNTNAGAGTSCSGVFVMKADGNELTRITPPLVAFFDVSWSPDGRQIAFEGDCSASDKLDICVVDADGNGIRPFVSGNGVGDPAWSPDGQRIAFTRQDSAGAGVNIFTASIDGGAEQQVTRESGQATQPSWSPDGTSIAFAAGHRFEKQIFVTPSEGGEASPLAPGGSASDAPAWSHDGTRIAFSSDRSGKPQSPYSAEVRKSPGSEGLPVLGARDIFVMNADGTNVERLTTDGSSNSSPTWSPDDQHIAFVTDREMNHDLYVMANDGSGQTRLSTRNSDSSSPSWIN